ncbi:MAG TPA: DUF3761 domain-containing protein [Kofleriaceae bacterium]
MLLAVIVALTGAPATAHAQTVTCADGTSSEAGRGACSHHGGVAKTRAPSKPHRAPGRTTTERTTTTRGDGVRCSDGTYSSATGRGACSRHGGVADEPARDTTQRRDRTDRDSDSRDRSIVARCADGSISIATGRGACSHHGGLANEQARTPTTERRTTPTTERRTTTREKPWWGDEGPREGEPLARCMDGSLSYSKHHRGTCSGHGGVRDWLDD